MPIVSTKFETRFIRSALVPKPNSISYIVPYLPVEREIGEVIKIGKRERV